MKGIWNKIKALWYGNLNKNLKLISEKVGAFICTVLGLFTPVLQFIVEPLIPVVGNFIMGTYVAFVAVLAYTIMKIMRENGYHDSKETK